MNRATPMVLAFLACGGVAAPALAQSSDPAAGRRLAASLCVECHRIDEKTPAENEAAKAPSFVDVARMPSTTELAIKVFLRSSHRNMPNLILTPDEIDSLSAYIVGLAPER
ncbi:c-type cytochrome [Methylosinus sp. PW1]|uniref:c-type cytochrome n=1 Tax=Methylosinus sp. PW1 TaxID=107636 RepID=UPI0005692DCC|nr:c-type cytochrome [Methylosinus sp. PW1]